MRTVQVTMRVTGVYQHLVLSQTGAREGSIEAICRDALCSCWEHCNISSMAGPKGPTLDRKGKIAMSEQDRKGRRAHFTVQDVLAVITGNDSDFEGCEDEDADDNESRFYSRE
ncbi:UNVERIFIED_CONTAM: hypothetical protein FKN15_030987 [Acipenser sinensis]